MSAGMEKRIDGALKRVQRESLPRRCSSGPWVAMFPDVWDLARMDCLAHLKRCRHDAHCRAARPPWMNFMNKRVVV